MDCRRGFTLVELLIVIVTMAILAGMVLPQFGAAVDDAKRAAVLADLHRLASAIERYKLDHAGAAPDQGNSLF